MNIHEYISSGIVESYVLGLASAEERNEFEKLCSRYPELIEARKKFEEAIEKQAMENSPSPPDSLKEKIWSAIQQDTKFITMVPTRKSTGIRWVAAASVILFLAAGYFAFKFYNDKIRMQDQLASEIKEKDSILNLIRKRQPEPGINDFTVITLKSMKGDPSTANIFWDSASANVYMVVKNMPKLPTSKQYQLWALIDNATKPVNLGQFDGGEKVMLKMNDVKKADVFAITIEDRGNTGGPDLKQLQSMTKLQ